MQWFDRVNSEWFDDGVEWLAHRLMVSPWRHPSDND
jgi:hypothetical protein